MIHFVRGRDSPKHLFEPTGSSLPGELRHQRAERPPKLGEIVKDNFLPGGKLHNFCFSFVFRNKKFFCFSEQKLCNDSAERGAACAHTDIESVP